MTKIFLKDNFKIIERENHIFSIQFPIHSEQIIKSIIKPRILLGATSTNEFQTLIFKAVSVKSFQIFKEELFKSTGSHSLPANLAAKLAIDLGRQIQYLITEYNQTILGVNPENLFVVDDNIFIYLSSEYLTEISPNSETMMVCYPIKPTYFFCAPEILTITEIPVNIHYKTSYFSVGILLLYALMNTKSYEFYEEYIQEEFEHSRKVKNICGHLNQIPIRQTKLSWFIERCLVEEAENRSIVFF
jgi:hypothetical protein